MSMIQFNGWTIQQTLQEAQRNGFIYPADAFAIKKSKTMLSSDDYNSLESLLATWTSNIKLIHDPSFNFANMDTENQQVILNMMKHMHQFAEKAGYLSRRIFANSVYRIIESSDLSAEHFNTTEKELDNHLLVDYDYENSTPAFECLVANSKRGKQIYQLWLTALNVIINNKQQDYSEHEISCAISFLQAKASKAPTAYYYEQKQTSEAIQKVSLKFDIPYSVFGLSELDMQNYLNASYK